MNILQVTLGFLPATAWGGPVKIVHNNAKELLRRGHQVTVYCTNLFDKTRKIQPHTFEDIVDGIRVVYFDTWRIPQWPGTLGPIWLPELKSRLQNELQAFDIVHLNGYRNLMNLQVVNAIQDSGIPLVIQPHGAMQIIVNSLFVKRVYDRTLGGRELKRAQAFIALQESEKAQIISYGVPSECIEVIANGLDPKNYDLDFHPGSFRKRYGISPDKKMILFLGRINRKKGVDMLIEAFSQLKDMDAVLVIVGPDDGQLSEVQTLIARYELSERVILTGLLSGNDVLEAYRDAGLFVLPCRTDTFPTTIMESCLIGIPMVVTDRCEIAHLVKDRIGEVAPFDANLFANAMRELLVNEEKQGRYITACSTLMESEFSIQNTVDRLESLYCRIMPGIN
jgi:glycosyltransferase involved in cell wall biosynthesis